MGILFGGRKKKKNSIIELGNGKKDDNNIINISQLLFPNQLFLKIHIVGSGEKKQYIINNIFKETINDNKLIESLKVTKEFKTNEFHWIAHIYKDGELNDEDCQEIEKEIKDDRKKKENDEILLKNQIILCFGSENVDILSKNFIKFRRSNMIFVTEKQCQLNPKMDKRHAINIIYTDIKDDKKIEMSNEDLNIQIISSLWELDCYYKEKGNLICRYTPDNIFNGLENNNPIFTLNILLIGLSRAGKSTFINLLSRKLAALEANLSSSVTKNISEYYLYKDDANRRKGAIKLIDTPGFVANKFDKLDEILNLIKNENQCFERKIHFIFFIIMNGTYSLEGKNLDQVFKALNESKVPVYFIINRVKKEKDFKEIITPIKEHFNTNGYKNLANDENFIKANFLKGDAGEIHGFNDIFSKISNYFKKNNYPNDDLRKEMKELLRDFRMHVESNDLFLTDEDETKLEQLKAKINFTERMNKINEILANNVLFNKINYDSIIEKGKISGKKCREVILSLSNLKGIFPEISQDLPVLSIYQAFMVKEIGAEFGFEIDSLNSGTKKLLTYIKKLLTSLEKKNINEENVDLKKIDIKEYKNAIEKKALELVENTGKTVITLAKAINEIYKIEGNKKGNFDDNKKFTNSVYEFCIFYFEKEIRESKGLVFLVNYFNAIQEILKDIDEYYIPKKDWDNYEMEIKKIKK